MHLIRHEINIILPRRYEDTYHSKIRKSLEYTRNMKNQYIRNHKNKNGFLTSKSITSRKHTQNNGFLTIKSKLSKQQEIGNIRNHIINNGFQTSTKFIKIQRKTLSQLHKYLQLSLRIMHLRPQCDTYCKGHRILFSQQLHVFSTGQGEHPEDEDDSDKLDQYMARASQQKLSYSGN